MQRTLVVMELFVLEILRLKCLAQDQHSDDDVSAISDSDSDILETVEKADFVEFWTTIAHLWHKLKKD